MQTYEEEGLGVNQVAKMHATGTPQGQTTVSCLFYSLIATHYHELCIRHQLC